MKQIILKIISASLVVFLSLGDSAQAQDERPSFEAGPYIFNLGLMAGYRNITTEAYGANPSDYWSEQRFYEGYGNYRSGLTLTSFNLYGEKSGKEGFFDQLFVNADGIGDPFTSASLRMRAFNQYDLKVSYRNAKYFLNRNDSIYTGLHKFDMTRQFMNASLEVNATEAIILKANFNSTGRTGNFRTTVSPFVVGGEETGTGNQFGGYARGNFYWMQTPLNDKTNEFGLAATIKVPTTDFTLGGGYRMFSQDYMPDELNDTSLTYYPAKGTVNWAGVFAGFPNSAAKAINNPLYSFDWKETQESTTPFGYLEVVSKPIKDLSVVANVRFEDTKMEGTIDGNMNGIMARTGGGLWNLADTTSGHFHNTFNTLVGSLSATGKVIEGLNLTGVYRYTSRHLESEGELMKNVGVTDTVTSTVYKTLFTGPFDNMVTSKVTQHFIEGFVNYTPINMLNLRAGVQLTMRSPEYNRLVEGEPDSVSNTNLSRETQGMTPFFSFWYRPVRELKISGRYSHSDVKVYEHGTTTEVDMPTRITPKVTDKYSIGIDADPIEDLRISAHFTAVKGSSELLNMIPLVQTFNPELTNEMQSIGGSIHYQMIEQVGITVTSEYRTNDFAIPSSFSRGQLDPTPLYGDSLTISVEQHTKDLFLDASVTAKPIKALEVVVGYSMIDSKEGSYITPDTKTGIAPDLIRIGGPYTWNRLHAQASYDITRNIGVQVDFQLVSQKEIQEADYPAVVNNYKATLIRGSVYFHL